MFSALGIWQLQRMVWKQDLIARVESRAHGDPIPLPAVDSWRGLNVDALEYQRVNMKGVFDHSAEVQTLAVTELGPGYWVLTPLLLEDERVKDEPLEKGRLEKRGTVLINRGFVPNALRDPTVRSEQPPEEVVSITGLLRRSEPDGGFLRDNDPAANRWFSRDTRAIAQAKKLTAPVAPFFIDAIDDAATVKNVDYPRGGLTVIAFRDTHLIYALTWFALALMSCFGIYLTLRDVNHVTNARKIA